VASKFSARQKSAMLSDVRKDAMKISDIALFPVLRFSRNCFGPLAGLRAGPIPSAAKTRYRRRPKGKADRYLWRKSP
jgi:hypothetical protein